MPTPRKTWVFRAEVIPHRGKPKRQHRFTDTNVAGYGLDASVTSNGWQHFQTIIHPATSEEKMKFYPGTASMGFSFRMGGKGTVYLDNLRLVPVEDGN